VAAERGGAGSAREMGAVVLLAALLAAAPLALDDFRQQLAAKYLCFAFPAVGLVLLWGYGGILSLGQGLYFGMGSYFMAMFLKLEAAAQTNTGSALSQFYGSNLPDFMVWNSVEALPWWWRPFHSLSFTVATIVIVPPLFAFLLAYANFRKRVGGVYFSIITLALAAIASIVIIGQQGYTGGVNGITDFKTFLGVDILSNGVKRVLYFVTLGLLLASVLAGRSLLASRTGKILVAIRDREDRVRFSGYNPATFKAFVFAAAALLASLGGALFALQEGLASPSLVGIVPSIEMVIYAAVGGRLSLVGTVYGTLVVFAAKTFFSENFPEIWLYLLGALFILVVVFLPTGLAGLVERLRWRPRVRPAQTAVTAPESGRPAMSEVEPPVEARSGRPA
jgi:urea transport system permease protein